MRPYGDPREAPHLPSTESATHQIMKTELRNTAISAVPRTSRLAAWSLALGVVPVVLALLLNTLWFAGGPLLETFTIWFTLLFFPFSALAAVSAIVCGHIGRARMKKNPALRGKAMALVGLAGGYLSLVGLVLFFVALIAPAIRGMREKAATNARYNHARQILTAMVIANAEGPPAWPADAGITSVSQLKQELVSRGALPEESRENLHFEDFLIGNVSAADPPDTIAVKSKSRLGEDLFTFSKDGDGHIYRNAKEAASKDPPRAPAYLAE